MAASNLVRFCTAAAFAGTLFAGIAIERYGINHKLGNSWFGSLVNDNDNDKYFDWIPRLASVDAKVQSNDGLSISQGKIGLVSNQERKPYNNLPATDPKQSTANFKVSSQHGLPSLDNLRLFNDFILSYDRRLRNPNWVLEHLTPEKLKGEAKRGDFGADTTLHRFFRAELSDYKSSGFDRGHLAAAANHKNSQINMDQTFFLSNIIPQDQTFNREGWNKLEKYVRWRTNKSKNMFVVSGPLYLPRKEGDGYMYVKYRVIGGNHIAVPTHLFKVMLYESVEGKYFMEAFVMSNEESMNNKVKLENHKIPLSQLDTIERAAGLIFFDKLDRNSLGSVKLLDGFKDLA